jgi:surfeit locus 1 family protein
MAVTGWACQWQYFKGKDRQAQAQLRERLEREGALRLGDNATRHSTAADLNRIAVARGEWLSDQAIYLDNRSNGQRAGFHLLVPQRFANDELMLINLGWIARPNDYPSAPKLDSTSLPNTVSGTLVAAQTRYVELGKAAPVGALWQNLDVAAYRAASRLSVSGQLLVANQSYELRLNDQKVRLVPAELSKTIDADRHFGYALQWGVMTLVVFGLWIGLNTRRTGNSAAG